MKMSLKVVAAVTLVCFLTTQAVWGAPGAGIEIAGKMELPAYLSIDIPAELGTVDSLYEAPAGANPQFILHIQNAHANYQAQMKIKQLLGYMNKKYGFSTIFVEGASEKLDPDYLRLFPDQERNLKLCDELAKQGELTGVELYMMEADSHIAALGIEEASLYKANYDALKKVFGAEADVTRFFKGFDAKLDKAASKVFTPETRALIADWKRFEQGRRDFMPFVRELAKKSKKILNVDVASLFAQVGWPQISRLLVIQQLEKDLDRAKGQEEQGALIQWLRGKNVSKELVATLENFNEGSIAVGKSTKEVSPREVLERLNAEAGPQGFKFSDYPAFSLFAGYVTLRSELDPKVLFEEIEYLFTQMLDKLAEEPKQKELLALYRDGELLRKLLHLELNRAQWRQAVAEKDRISVPSLVARLKDAVISSGDVSVKKDQEVMPKAFSGKMDELYTAGLEFYDYARMRESVFYKQMQSAMAERKITKAILITGGFHTDGMSDLFRENAISYGIVTPRLSEKSDESLYRATMLQDREHLFSISYIEMVSKMLNINVLVGNGVDVGKLYAGLIDVAAKMDNASVSKVIAEFNRSPLAVKNNIVIAQMLDSKGGVAKGENGQPVYKIFNREYAAKFNAQNQTGQIGPNVQSVTGSIIPTIPVATAPSITTAPGATVDREAAREFWGEVRETLQSFSMSWNDLPMDVLVRIEKYRADLPFDRQATPSLTDVKRNEMIREGVFRVLRSSPAFNLDQKTVLQQAIYNDLNAQLELLARSEMREAPASREVGHWVSAALAVPALSGLMLAFPVVEKVAIVSIPILLGVVVTAVVVDRVRSESRGPGVSRSETRAGMETVTLKNGAVEARALVNVLMMSLQALAERNPIGFYELVMKARDPKHQFWGNTVDDLKALSLVQGDGNLHDSVRNVVLSATEGEGLDMRLTNPVRSEVRVTLTDDFVNKWKTAKEGNWLLLLEDSKLVRDEITRMLKAAGHDVVAVIGVREAIAELNKRVSEQGRPYILTDNSMPGDDRQGPTGTEFVKAIKAMNLSTGRIVMMTMEDPENIKVMQRVLGIPVLDKAGISAVMDAVNVVKSGPRSEVRAGMEILSGVPFLNDAVQSFLASANVWAAIGAIAGVFFASLLSMAFPKAVTKSVVWLVSPLAGAGVGLLAHKITYSVKETVQAVQDISMGSTLKGLWNAAFSDPFITFLVLGVAAPLIIYLIVDSLMQRYSGLTLVEWFRDVLGPKTPPAPIVARREPGVPARPTQTGEERVTEEIETEGVADITDPRELVVKMDESRYLVIENPVKGPDVTRSWVSSGSADGSFPTYRDALAAAGKVLGLSVDIDSRIQGSESAPSVPPLRLALVNNPDKKSYAVAIEIEPIRGTVDAVLVRAVTKSGNLIQEMRVDRGNSIAIGRREGSGIRLTGDTGISRTHLTVNFTPTGLRIRDGDGQAPSSYGVRVLPVRAELRAIPRSVMMLAALASLVTATPTIANTNMVPTNIAVQAATSQVAAPNKLGFDAASEVYWLFDTKSNVLDQDFKKALDELIKQRNDRAKANNLNLLPLSEEAMQKTVSKASPLQMIRGLHKNGFLLEYIPQLNMLRTVDLETTASDSFRLPGDGSRLIEHLQRQEVRSEVRAGFGRIQSLAVASVGLLVATVLVAGMLRFSAWRDAQLTKAADALDREVAAALQVSPESGMEWTPILMSAYLEYLRAKNLADNRENFRGFMSDETLIKDYIYQLNPDAIEDLRGAQREWEGRQSKIGTRVARPESRSEVRLEREKIRTVAAVASASTVTAALIVTVMLKFAAWQDARLEKAAAALDRQVAAVLAIAPEESPGWTPLFMNAYYEYLQNGNLADTHENFVRFQSDAVLVETYIEKLNPDALQELYKARAALQDRLDRSPAPMDYDQITNRNSVLSGQLPSAISLGVALDKNGTPYGVAVNYSTSDEQVTPIPVAPVLDYRVGTNGVLYALHLNTETRLPEIARFPKDARDLPVTSGEYRLDRDLGISFETLKSEAPDVAQAWAAVLGRSELRGREPNMLEAAGIITGMMSGFQFVLALIGNSRESVAHLARPPFDIYRDEWLVGALVTLGFSGSFFLVNYLAGIIKNAFTGKPAPVNPQAGIAPKIIGSPDLNVPVTAVPTRLPSQNQILDSLAGLKAEMQSIIAGMEDRYTAGVDADDLAREAESVLATMEDRNLDVANEDLRKNTIAEIETYRRNIQALLSRSELRDLQKEFPRVDAGILRALQQRQVAYPVIAERGIVSLESWIGDQGRLDLEQILTTGNKPNGLLVRFAFRNDDGRDRSSQITAAKNYLAAVIELMDRNAYEVRMDPNELKPWFARMGSGFTTVEARIIPQARAEIRSPVEMRQEIAEQASDLLAPDIKAWLIENRPEFGADSLANVLAGIVVPSQIQEAMAQDAAKGIADVLTAYVTQMRSGTFSFGEFMRNVRDIITKNPAFAVSNERGAVVKVMNQLPSNEELAALGVQLAMNPNLEFNFVIELNDAVEQGMPVFEVAVADIQKMFGANDLKIGNRLAVSYGTAGQLAAKAKNAAGQYKDLGVMMGDHVTILVEVPEMAGRLVGAAPGAVVDVPKINPKNASSRNFVAGKFSQFYVQSDAEGAMGQLIKSLGDVRAIVKNGRYFDMDDAALSGLAKIWSDIISIAATAKAA